MGRERQQPLPLGLEQRADSAPLLVSRMCALVGALLNPGVELLIEVIDIREGTALEEAAADVLDHALDDALLVGTVGRARAWDEVVVAPGSHRPLARAPRS